MVGLRGQWLIFVDCLAVATAELKRKRPPLVTVSSKVLVAPRLGTAHPPAVRPLADARSGQVCGGAYCQIDSPAQLGGNPAALKSISGLFGKSLHSVFSFSVQSSAGAIAISIVRRTHKVP